MNASATFDDVTSSSTNESFDFFGQVRQATAGLKLTSMVYGLINFSIATAIAWSCSNLLIAIVAFVVSLLIGALIGLALMALVAVKCTDSMVALGAKYEALIEWLNTKFGRKG